MNILTLECSTVPSSLYLSIAGGEHSYEYQWHTERSHDAELFPALQRCMHLLEGQSLDLIIVGAGPGSYGGVRVALAAAQGIALVHGCQVVALDSWSQLSQGESRYLISDAKRGGWTLRHPGGNIEVASLSDIEALLAEGKPIATIEHQAVLQQHKLSLDVYGLNPNAQGLLASWQALTTDQQEHLRATPPAPIYVRQPHITKAKRKPWECG